ncbi:MAG: hypothetical protein M0R50_11170 [Candidatus Cloacimonetes bacterium]|jgi:hypothetical protein|nr:hypothetical protein [Candidatus Cloacimonadota bacterium]
MSIINVISVDLGDPIEKIISEDVRQLSEETIENIRTAASEKAKGPRRTDPESLATEAAYELLLSEISKDPVEISRLLEVSSPAVTNPSSLMMRMKGLLRQKGNEYFLKRSTRGGKPVYRLVPYNLEIEDATHQ